MKNLVKRSTTLVLIFTLILGISRISLGVSPTEKINKEYYDVYKLEFESLDYIINSNIADKDDIDSILMKQKRENIAEAKEKVKSLKLEEKGFYRLEEAYLKELDELFQNEAYIEDYAIYVPNPEYKLTGESDPIYYGTYEGFRFMSSFSVYNQSYRKENKDWRKIDTWVKGLVDLIMNFVHDYISIPFSVLDASGNEITIYSGAWVDTTISEEVTSRLILIQDLDMKYTPSPNNYVGVLNDMSKVVSIYTVLYPNSPYFPPEFTGQKGPEEVPSKYFYNRTKTMHNALMYYIQSDGSGLYQDLVPLGSLGWSR